ncbi:SH3 domain-containing protein [Butyrivibrio sp. VCB2006]|uniref:SH3 domain-containing protein n=1 Tax=Butyrivibrio sp. VCB2006 TaxID=1280679 RepID=UPI00040E8A11|nr:SH3 domain-containing protein [Butyrivibrio sp. VCB2006]
MADKITNFEDYKKKGNVEDTTDIDIQIVDPYNFFNEEEREEYFQERQKEIARENEAAKQSESKPELEQRPEPERPMDEPPRKPGRERNSDRNDEEPIRHRRPRREEIEEPEEDEEEYEEEPEETEEDDSEGGFPIELFIRISSIITGVIILAFIAIVVKVKIFDRYFAQDPDEAQTVEVALPVGYTETNDTVVVTAEKLNLRTVDNSQSDATIFTSVDKGTELKRIAVNSENTWALVEYNGTRVYASMKYLTTK